MRPVCISVSNFYHNQNLTITSIYILLFWICLNLDPVPYCCRHRLELMREIYDEDKEDSSPQTPEAPEDFFHCLAACRNPKYFNFYNLIPSRLVGVLELLCTVSMSMLISMRTCYNTHGTLLYSVVPVPSVYSVYCYIPSCLHVPVFVWSFSVLYYS